MDALLSCADNALRTLSGTICASRPSPAPESGGAELRMSQRRLSGALMRVNHVGEVCAQALYSAQALTTDDASLREQFLDAAREETDHLAWTRQRLQQLGQRTSLLNPLWYAGAFGIGLLAGQLGPRASLGFLLETERQVERHLQGHLERLPQQDLASRAIVEQMQKDEAGHAEMAESSGAAELPAAAKAAMRVSARLMTRIAHYV